MKTGEITTATTDTKPTRGRPRTKEIVTTGATLAQITERLERDPRLSVNSRRAYREALAEFETWRNGRSLTKLTVEAYAAHLQTLGRATTGINQALSAIRWWARKVADMALESDMPEDKRRQTVELALRAADVENLDGKRLPVGRIITTGELAALLDVCARDASPAGARDAAIIAVEAKAGMRRGELVTLTMADWQDNGGDGVLVVRKAKRNKERKCFVRNGAYAALKDWLAVRGTQPGALFLAIHKDGSVQPKGITTVALGDVLAKRCTQAGIGAPTTWHDFRRTFASTLLDAGVDLVTVSRLMGHEQPTTTARYDLRGEDVQRKAVDAIHVPYMGRRA